MEGDPAGVAALQSICATASRAKGRMLKSIIDSCLKAPNIFVFSELLAIESVQQLRSDDALKSTWNDIELFAFGTYPQYRTAEPGFYSELKPEAVQKLKKLTIVTLGSQSPVLKYDDLLQALEIETVRQLEDLFIECMYHGIVKGKIDHRARQFVVDFTIGRDVRPDQVPVLLRAIQSWSVQAEVLLGGISEQMNNIMSEREKHRLHKLDIEQTITLTKESLKQEDLLHENLGDGMMRRKKGPRRMGKGRPDEFFMDRRKL